ncbi:MAG: DUF2513 domain-containing protein [Telluria sp.]
MRRDMDLVRGILKFMEAQAEGINVGWNIVIDGYTDEQIGYHAHLLAQAGLILAADATYMESNAPSALPLSLTWQGHDFLESIKDDALWAKAKKHVLMPAGGAAFSVLTEWIKAEAKQRLGLPP